MLKKIKKELVASLKKDVIRLGSDFFSKFSSSFSFSSINKQDIMHYINNNGYRKDSMLIGDGFTIARELRDYLFVFSFGTLLEANNEKHIIDNALINISICKKNQNSAKNGIMKYSEFTEFLNEFIEIYSFFEENEVFNYSQKSPIGIRIDFLEKIMMSRKKERNEFLFNFNKNKDELRDVLLYKNKFLECRREVNKNVKKYKTIDKGFSSKEVDNNEKEIKRLKSEIRKLENNNKEIKENSLKNQSEKLENSYRLKSESEAEYLRCARSAANEIFIQKRQPSENFKELYSYIFETQY